MSRNAIRLLIVFACLLLLGLVTTQVLWVTKAYQIQQKQFSYDVTDALKEIANQILKHNNDSTPLPDPVKQLSDNTFRVSLNDTLHPYYLESLLKQEFVKREINGEFEYSIYDCFNDSVVYTNRASTHDSLLTIQNSEFAEINWDKNGHYFGVYFPNVTAQILSRMKFWFVSTFVLIIVIVFFFYTILLLLKQRKLSESTTDFINNMTHEFKTPVSTISLSCEVLDSPNIINEPTRLKEYVSIIGKENNRLKKQIDRVLQIASIDKREVKLYKTSFDIHALIAETCNSMRVSVESVSATIHYKLNAKNSTVLADEIHIGNIVSNIIDNALKYNTNTPEITITTLNSGTGIKLLFEDNGIGIEKEKLKHIFDKFYRVSTGNVHDVKGFGLGLNYVKNMVEAHHGHVKVSSTYEKGSVFEVYLPFKE